ncbi:MAG: YicC family protein [Betaproteobacteria bacterium RIFCSPLOWO2_12_FULL_62_13]|nr:MAG: YicC family protein [Betaproteobacteria bacterium RIFCSPLOWO2_12_FULL_62_13]
MIYSMTGYAAAAKEFAFGLLNVELRSVNHRYLDVQFRLPDELRAVEAQLRELLAAKLNRGKVECRVTFAATAGAGQLPELNEGLLRQLIALDSRVRAMFPAAASLGVPDILRWPGMLGTEALPVEELQTACRELLQSALDEFTASRAREGEKLRGMLIERATAMEQRVADIAPRMPQAVAAFQEKLAARLKEALATGDDERIRQEVVLFANKIDVDEELSRLTTHIVELKRILERGGAVGKRLDFLMQELNREANTLGSKSVDITVTQAAMELKILIEQMREQIQNIE